MSKELEALEDIILYLNAAEPKGLYCKNIEIIKTALKNYEELTSKPVILCGRTHGNTHGLVNAICTNYKEVEVTNLKDEKKLKALEIIKKKRLNADEIYHKDYEWYMLDHRNDDVSLIPTKEEFEILKEALL